MNLSCAPDTLAAPKSEPSSAEWNKIMSTSKAGLEIKNGIAVVRFDNPPVNSLGLELRQSIAEAVERANADPGIDAVVLIGSGAGFSGGADIREFGTPKAVEHPNLRTVLGEIEASAKPVIAAI